MRELARPLLRSAVTLAVIAAAVAACTGATATPLPGDGGAEPPVVREPARPAASGTSPPTVAPEVAPIGQVRRPAEPSPQSPWVRARVEAVKSIWGFSEQGAAWLDSYDLRQMVAQPTWYGSYGFSSWAGAGQAVPRLVLHELSHSYWGAFPVDGRPKLSWEASEEGAIAPAMAQYRADLNTFMSQPPDRFEPLRDRFRNLPNISDGDYPDLYHFGEADMLYTTGGRLGLVPPILRKYYARYLAEPGVGERGLQDWADALAWFKGLDETAQREAGTVFAIQHIPEKTYEDLPALDGATVPASLIRVLQAEERQRLRDFAEQLEEIKAKEFGLVDAAGIDRGFEFWRGYVREMRDLYRKHPAALEPVAAGGGLVRALELYVDIEGMDAEEQVAAIAPLLSEPAVLDLAILLKGRALISLFGGGGTGGAQGVDAVIARYASRLAVLARLVDRVVARWLDDPAAAALILEEHLSKLSDEELAGTVNVVFDLLRETKRDVAEDILPLLSDALLRHLLDVSPAAARAREIAPARLLRAAGATEEAPVEALQDAITLLVDNSSGNFAIDERFDDAVYELLGRPGGPTPATVLAIFEQTGLRVIPWLRRHAGDARRILAAAPDAAATLIASHAGPHRTPSAVLRAVADLDPELAADLTARLEQAAEGSFAAAALIEFAHDAYWAARSVRSDSQIAQGARFIAALESRLGGPRFGAAFEAAVDQYRLHVAAHELDADFEGQHRRSLERLAEAARDPKARSLLLSLAAGLSP